VLAHCQEYGEFLTVKIENMTLQHNETEQKKPQKRRRARRKFAVVTVASGQGLVDTFKEMGVDYVIEGGQTNNPSAEAFIEAFDEVNADHVFVFPNNGNIILAAKQAGDMYTQSDIRVIESKSVGEGYSAMSMLDFGADDADEIETSIKESMQNVTTGMVSRVARDATVNGVAVQKDGYMGFTNKTMLVAKETKGDTVCALIDALDVKNKEFLIAVYGVDATEEEREILRAHVAETCPNIELYEIDGKQEVYDYILIVE
jgi:dihydroxyacetone kinase-like predicted kinase